MTEKLSERIRKCIQSKYCSDSLTRSSFLYGAITCALPQIQDLENRYEKRNKK